MTQYHGAQDGIFHVTTNAKARSSWCTLPGIPEILIDNMCMTRNLHSAKLYAFCVLPDHMHIIFTPGKKGLSTFMHSFKRNASKDAGIFLACRSGGSRSSAPGEHIPFTGWQHGFHDEHILDADQRDRALNYVRNNASRHGLVAKPEDWPWTSLQYPHMLDELEVWW